MLNKHRFAAMSTQKNLKMALHLALRKISLVMISLTYLGNKPETQTKLFKMSLSNENVDVALPDSMKVAFVLDDDRDRLAF